MKKIILLAFTTLIMVGCGEASVKKVHIKEGERIISIDSCEYIEREVYYGSMLVHKGNCRFCKERDSIKWEKRKKELEELVIKLKKK